MRATEALTLLIDLTKELPGIPEYQQQLASAKIQVGHVFLARGDTSEAFALYTESRTLLEGLSASNQDNDHLLGQYTLSLRYVGSILATQGKLQEARELQSKAATIADKLVAKSPGNASIGDLAGGSHFDLGDVFWSSGRLDQAAASFRKCSDIVEGQIEKHPEILSLKSSAVKFGAIRLQSMQASLVGGRRDASRRGSQAGRAKAL